mmetsp:Transcript_11361/g.34421  ORF Transcript_11361/g.34421 Transcript_11361/m.34421 type:complete len:240 (+) Transcript_11361:1150-1869(+)
MRLPTATTSSPPSSRRSPACAACRRRSSARTSCATPSRTRLTRSASRTTRLLAWRLPSGPATSPAATASPPRWTSASCGSTTTTATTRARRGAARRTRASAARTASRPSASTRRAAPSSCACRTRSSTGSRTPTPATRRKTPSCERGRGEQERRAVKREQEICTCEGAARGCDDDAASHPRPRDASGAGRRLKTERRRLEWSDAAYQARPGTLRTALLRLARTELRDAGDDRGTHLDSR